MRITNSMMMNNYLYDLSGNLNRLSKYLEQQSTGKSINAISDDPIGTTKSLMARNRLSRTARYQKNVGAAMVWLTEVESALGELNKVVQSAYEKAVSAATGTLSDEDRNAIAEEIAQLRDEVLDTANTTVGDSYLFSGYNTTGSSDGKRPFAVDVCGDIYYNGINMSNEASAEVVRGAKEAAEAALSEAEDADNFAQGAELSDRSAIIAAVKRAANAVRQIADMAAQASSGAEGIANSKDAGGTTMSELLKESGGAARLAAEAASAAASQALSLADAAQEAADAENRAYIAWQSAVGTGEEESAWQAYQAAQTAADTAIAAARSASASAVSAGTAAKEATDKASDLVGASDSLNKADSLAAEAFEAATTADAAGDYAGVSNSVNTVSEMGLAAAESCRVFAEAGSVLGSGPAADIESAITALEAVAAAAAAAAGAVTDGASSATAIAAAADVQTAAANLRSVVQSYVDGYDALSRASDALDAESEDSISLQAGCGQAMEISVTGTELLGRGGENLYVILNSFYKTLKSGAGPKEISAFIERLQGAQNNILALEAKVGAKMQRLDTLSARYEANVVNYTKMRSDAEDVDMAEAIMHYKTAETVYNAALATGSEIIQNSLIDFLR